jgi:hypothetical protein
MHEQNNEMIDKNITEKWVSLTIRSKDDFPFLRVTFIMTEYR